MVILGVLEGKATFTGFFSQLLYFYNYYALFFDGYSNVPKGTSILWSLAIEEHFYIIYPLLFSFLTLKFDYKKVGIFFVIFCIIILFWRYYLTLAPNFNPDRTYYATDTRLDSILFGCILAVIKNPMNDKVTDEYMTLLDSLLLIASIGLILSSLLIRNVQFRESFRYSIQGVALMPIFYFAITKSKSILYKFLNLKLLRQLGELSYSVYLIHYILINIVFSIFHKFKLTAFPLIVFAITLVTSIIYAIFIDRFIEPYFKVLRKKFH